VIFDTLQFFLVVARFYVHHVRAAVEQCD